MHLMQSILISGASLAGPTLAYWLDLYGFDVTVVERAPSLRSGGYPIDVRGSAVDVLEQMGVLPAARAAHIGSRSRSFVDAQGSVLGTIPPYEMYGNDLTRDIELPRGKLTSLLYELTTNSVRYRFADSIDSLEDDGAGVNVFFQSGAQQRYDVVIGADGLHSRTRLLAFGPEQQFSRYLGRVVNLFSLPNDMKLSHGGIIYAEPGRVAALFAVGDAPIVFAFLAFASEEPPFAANPDVQAQIARTALAFAKDGWEVPRLLAALRQANDLYFDTVSQIHMQRWSTGRVALVGDAAYAPSLLTGQGTSLALVGAYVLAGELAAHDDPGQAFASYERITRPYIEANQALVTQQNASFALPRTQADIDARNRMLASWDKRDTQSEDPTRGVYNALRLPDYRRYAKA